MPELIAEEISTGQQWRKPLVPAETMLIGRDPHLALCVPWDRHLSRQHAELRLDGSELIVRKLPEALNPLYCGGKAVEHCRVRAGECFVIGSTTFRFVSQRVETGAPSGHPVEEVTFSRQALAQVRYRDADRRLDVLARVPELISSAQGDQELQQRLVNLLRAGIASADVAALVRLDRDNQLTVLQWDRRREAAGAFRPSSRLVTEAVVHRQQTVLHVWESGESSSEFTATQEFDWAFCTPVRGPEEERWALYLAGQFDHLSTQIRLRDDPQLQGDVKFAELVAEIVASVRRLKALERRQAGLCQFFPPVILNALGNEADAELLQPRESDVTVLFCDLRGFSRQAEVARDNLIGLLDRVSQALAVMTRAILKHGGVIGDFQGDAAMGFWGWPVASDDAPIAACKAALEIRRAFTEAAGLSDHPLANFQSGMGLARGRAVAGKIGTSEHVKVTVFGPVVNLAARLEGLTKPLRVSILLDESLAATARAQLPADVGRVRKLAKVQPYGLETALTVSELLPSEAELPELTAEHLAEYDRAVEEFIAGRWENAYKSLRYLPPSDRAQDFLALQIAQFNRVAPGDWTGTIRFHEK